MVTIPLGIGAYKRNTYGEAEVRLVNRFVEKNPANLKEKIALLARPGTARFNYYAGGRIRTNFTTAGLFNGDLFTVSGENLYRTTSDGEKTLISGVVNGSGTPSIGWQKGIGYERLFIADGLLLQYYDGGTHATGTLRYSTYDYSWDSQSSANDNDWRGVCWSPELTLFVAVASSAGSGGQVMTSPDGVTWTERTAAASQSWWSVCWSADLGLFVAVAFGGAIMTSTDGVAWTSRTSPTTADLLSVCWAPDIGMFVAVGSTDGTDDIAISSPDGVNWTARTAAMPNIWQGVCWSPDLELFAAVSSTGIANRVMTSPDGINWESQTSAGDHEWRSIDWSPQLSLYCAVSDSGYAMVSSDGKSWSESHMGVTGMTSVAWSPDFGIFTAVGSNGVATSPDGVNWTARTEAANNDWRSVCYARDLLMLCAVAHTGSGDRVMTSQESSVASITDQVIEIGGSYYAWDDDVDNNSPDGTAAHPWLAKLADTSADCIANMAKLLNFDGTRGTDFSTTLGGPNTLVTADADELLLTLTAISDGSDGNDITTSVYSGSGLTWSGATLSGGGTHALHGILTPDGVTVKSLASLAGYVLVSVTNSQKCFFIRPGETTIDPLSFFEKEVSPDNIEDMVVLGDELIMFGNGSTESFYATGDADAPFAPTQGRVYQRGVIPGTAVVVNDAVIFVGADLVVYAVGPDGSTTVDPGVNRISNNGIEERIRAQLRREQGLS